MKKSTLLMVAVATLTACSDNLSSLQEKAGRSATSFAEAYFNYDYVRANELITPESEKWIRYAATNTSQEDLDMLNTRSEAASIELLDCEQINDTTCEVLLQVDDYLAIDSIGRPGEFRSGDEFRLKTVLRDGKWQVRMEGLPRSEKHSRD
jgi:hypothetical protein